MYLGYFGLSEPPFSITPDPGFVYLSSRHRDALAHLLYGVGQGGSGGFVQLTGEVGTGKTTLCRCLLEQVPPGTRIALVLNPLLSPLEMLQSICEELGVDIAGAEGSPKVLVDRLNAFLLAAHQAGERVVLVIDEAQNLSPESLEQVRLLTNLETSKDKLLQIILLGQPELRELLQRRNLRQLAQRITARYHLTPLGPQDTAAYVRHRLEVAGAPRNPFRRGALKALYERAQGVPRLINIIADRALAGAYAAEKAYVDARMVHAAADEIQLGEPGVRRARWPWLALGAALVLAGLALWWLPGEWSLRRSDATPADTTGPAQAAPEVPADSPLETAEQPPPANLQPPAASDPLPATTAADAPATAAAEASDAPVPTGPPPGDPLPDTVADRLDDAFLDAAHERAFDDLAAAWGTPADGAQVAAACAGDSGQGYGCLREEGNWARIRRLDLPVLLVLQMPAERLLLLAGVRDDVLLLGPPDARRTVSREALEPFWLGAWYVAWPQSPGWPRELGPGDSGPAVAALLEMAGQAQPPYTGPAAYGAEFEAWLRDFQLRNGLLADGIVGPKTLLYLMRASISEPSLAGGG